MTSPSDIVSETFTGNEKPEGFDPAIRDRYAEAVSQYYVPTPVGGANKEEIRQVISAPVAPVEEPKNVVPERDTDDTPTLYAWYGPYGYAEHWRKVCLASCREIIRAKAATEGTKLTVDRVDDLARLHPNYTDFLITHLKGRTDYENAFLASAGMR